MLAVKIPKETSEAARMFLFGWSACMQGMMLMSEKDKEFIKKLFEETLEPQAHCPEMKALDHALIAYLMHKCGSPEHVGSEAPKADA